MLGEKLGEINGKITGLRVLEADYQGPRVEVSFQGAGKFLGLNVNDMGTYSSVLTKNKTFDGHGQGIIMTNEGEAVTWIGQGIGKPTGKGQAANWRGSVFYKTDSQKFARLNDTASLFEFDIDENGNLAYKIFEWK
jgi:hypothetical protein